MTQVTSFPITGPKAIRWLPILNTGIVTIPQYAPVLINGASLAANHVIFRVAAPESSSENEQDVRRHLINGPEPILPNAAGKGTRDWPCQAAYDYDGDGPIAIGDSLGFQQSSFKLHQGHKAFVCVADDPASGDVIRTCWVVPEGLPNARFQYPGGGTVSGGSFGDRVTTIIDPSYGSSPAGPSVFGHASFCEEVSSGSGKGIKVLQDGMYLVWFNGCVWVQQNDPADDGGITIAFYKNDAITGVRVDQRYPLVTASSGTGYLHSGGEAVSLCGIVACEKNDVLDVRFITGSSSVSIPFDGTVTWYGAGFGCHKLSS